MSETIFAPVTTTNQDLTGHRFNRLTAARFVKRRVLSSGLKRDVWSFVCDCGNEVEIDIYSVLTGRTKSCGCYRTETTRKRSTTHGCTVNRRATRLFRIWRNILQRCNDQNSPNYKRYGGRGIKVLWACFEDFKRDMEAGYADNLSIDRIDNNGHYCKENCRWATRKEQSRNTRRNRIITYEGQSKTMAEWAESTGIPSKNIWDRIKKGWTVERCLTTPVKYGIQNGRKC